MTRDNHTGVDLRITAGAVATFAACAFVLMACGEKSNPPPTFDTEAHLLVPSPYFTFDQSLKDLSCDTTGKWADIHTGTPVTLTHDGKTVAEGQLTDGFNTIRSCQFHVQLKGVPELAGEYALEVGDVLRQTMTAEQLKVHNFEIRTG